MRPRSTTRRCSPDRLRSRSIWCAITPAITSRWNTRASKARKIFSITPRLKAGKSKSRGLKKPQAEACATSCTRSFSEKFFARQRGNLDERLEFGPHHGFGDAFDYVQLSEAAIGAGDHVFSAGNLR